LQRTKMILATRWAGSGPSISPSWPTLDRLSVGSTLAYRTCFDHALLNCSTFHHEASSGDRCLCPMESAAAVSGRILEMVL
jgi:hypothetical protein